MSSEANERVGLAVAAGSVDVGVVDGDETVGGETAPPDPPVDLAPGPFDELDVADVVHYVQDLQGGSGFRQCRPAIVVRVWGVSPDVVQLVVVSDGTNDDPYNGQIVRWESSVQHADPKAPGGPEPRTWHFKGECR